MKDEIIAKIAEIICKIIDSDEEISPEDSIIEDIGISSMESVQLITALEQIYNVKITGKMLFSIDTVEDLADAIIEQIQ